MIKEFTKRLFAAPISLLTLSRHSERRYRPDFESLNTCLLRDPGEGRGEEFVRLWRKLAASDRFCTLVSEDTVRRYPEISSSGNRWPRPEPAPDGDRLGFITVYDEKIPVDDDFFRALHALGERRQDVLYRLRPHRFAFLPAWVFGTIGGHDAPRINQFIEQWMVNAREDDSGAYFSNMLVIQRLLVVCWCLRILMLDRGQPDALQLNLLKILVADIAFLHGRLGDAVANNHLLIDYFGGWFVEFVLPDLVDVDVWGEFEAPWLREWERQVYDDGSGFEASSHYHEIASEVSAIYVLLKKKAGETLRQEDSTRLEKMLRFQTVLAGETGKPISLGNATEDSMFPFCGEPGRSPGGLREIYRGLYDAGVPVAPRWDFSVESAYWLLDGGLCPPEEEGVARDTPVIHSFPDGGIIVWETPATGDRLVFRTAPRAGLPSHAGHAHADLHAVYLTADNEPVWVDSGTHSYRYGVRDHGINWRAYLASPEAHNGLMLDAEDPLGTLNRDFRNARCTAHGRTRVLQSGAATWMESELQTGNVYNGARRGIIVIADDYWLIYDLLPVQARGETSAELRFQCAEGCEVFREENGLTIDNGCTRTRLWLGRNLSLQDIRTGSLDPLGGWVSDSYGRLEAAPQICLRILDPQATSVIAGQFASQASPPLRCTESREDGLYHISISFPEYEDRLVISESGDDRKIGGHPGEGIFASMLWTRLRGGVIESALAMQGVDRVIRSVC